VVAKKGWLVTILIGCGVDLGVTIYQLKTKNCCFCSSCCIVWRWERGVTNERIIGDEYHKFRNDIPSDGGVFGYRLLIEKLSRRASFTFRDILTNSHNLPCVFGFNEVEGLHTSFFSIVIYATSVEKYL
jgi:hypothetical protein